MGEKIYGNMCGTFGAKVMRVLINDLYYITGGVLLWT